ncbi:hypothetical protein H4S08_004867 [Coemansia sp. RSA 1365]|nr:hypothetical protein H4S08_004867 [Coemansia sp. RSA 1365]
MSDPQVEAINHLIQEVTTLREQNATNEETNRNRLLEMRNSFQRELDQNRGQAAAPRVRVPAPEPFTGNPKKLEEFLHKLTVYFHAMSATYVQERDMPEIQIELQLHPLDGDLEDHFLEAIRIDEILYRANGRNKPNPPRNVPSIPPPRYNGPMPMEIDAVRTAPRGPLTHAEREHRRMHNLCYYCAQNGHIARECPRKQNRGRVAAVAPQTMDTTPEADLLTLNPPSQDFGEARRA